MDGLTQFIREENNNTRIEYEPSSAWSGTSKTSSIFQIGNMGAPVSSLLEATFNGSVSFTFEGIAIAAVISYINPSNTPIGSKVGSCSVDNELFGATIPPSSQNNWQFCSSGVLPDGIHILTMNFSTPQSVGSPQIFFDYFLYAPSPANKFNSTDSDVSILVESSDPAITYSGSFVIESDTDSTRLSNSKSASITVPFFGHQLTWYGAYSTSIPSTSSLGEYSIDGGTPTQFTLSGSNPASPLLNQLLFQTEVLPQGSHQLTATYLSDAQAPLSLSFVVVRNFSSTTTTDFTTAIPSPTTAFPSQSTSTGSSHNHQSIIIGIVVRVSIFLITIGIMLRRHIKRRVLQCLETRRKNKDEGKEELPEISLNQYGTMPAVSIVTITPDAFEMDDMGEIGTDSLLTPDRNAIFNAQPTPADSTETLLNASLSYTTHTPTPTPTLTPFEIPSLPVMDIGKMAARRLDNSQDSEVHHRSANDADNSEIVSEDSQQLQLPSSLLDRMQEEKEEADPGSSSDAAIARAATLQMLITRRPTLRPSLTSLNSKEMHMDSGVRLGGQTLIYDETSSAEWSLRSKRRLPPGYTHD